jgi:hypothetical protein
MKHSRQLKKNRDNNPFLLLPISRRKAKGKSGNSGILPRNGQIQLVSMETIFNRPNWTKYQH